MLDEVAVSRHFARPDLTKDLTRARRRAALRKRKLRIAHDTHQFSWLRHRPPEFRARRIGRWATTPAPRSCRRNGPNPRRPGSSDHTLTRQEREHLRAARNEVREVRAVFAAGAPRGALRVGGR
jgi:hypothetical protein